LERLPTGAAAEAGLAAVTDWRELPAIGAVIMADGPLARLFWRIFDGLDYWMIMQGRLWVVDAVCGPVPDDGSPD
jgi:hypothetical protein